MHTPALLLVPCWCRAPVPWHVPADCSSLQEALSSHQPEDICAGQSQPFPWLPEALAHRRGPAGDVVAALQAHSACPQPCQHPACHQQLHTGLPKLFGGRSKPPLSLTWGHFPPSATSLLPPN